MIHADPARTRTVVPAQRGVTRNDLVRVVLWAVAVAAAVVNTVASYRGASLGTHLVCGLITAAGVGVLVVDGRRRR
ncbi:hypothetical protein [Streptomyces sp. NPDC060184]|uniref:hypothetical protein n=1 Tax=Streptomyces sp. NPDC060184 TaxID=3347064 RepID=UPI0036675C06